jgi:predicted RNA-binding Zn-ribbon protein involved in translation (DUF1610 family)
MSTWYYAKGYAKCGPVTSKQLKQLAEDGQLMPDDTIWKEGVAGNRKAKSVQGLFPAPLQPPKCTSCKTEVPNEAKFCPACGTAITSPEEQQRHISERTEKHSAFIIANEEALKSGDASLNIEPEVLPHLSEKALAILLESPSNNDSQSMLCSFLAKMDYKERDRLAQVPETHDIILLGLAQDSNHYIRQHIAKRKDLADPIIDVLAEDSHYQILNDLNEHQNLNSEQSLRVNKRLDFIMSSPPPANESKTSYAGYALAARALIKILGGI